MGINVLNNTSSGEVRLVAGATVSAGDLIVNSESGVALPASTGLTMAQNNNTTEGLAAIYAAAALTVSNTGGVNTPFSPCMAQLGDGNIALAYPGNGTTATTGLTLLFRNMQGTSVGPTVTVSADTAVYSAQVVKLDANSVLVGWMATTTLKFAIYSNAGDVIKSATTVATVSDNNFKYWNITALSSGNFVVAYRKVTSLDLEFQRFDATGTLQGSATTVEAASTPTNIVILPQSSGGFVVYYYRSAATAAYKFARYDSSGALQGSLTTVIATGSYLTGGFPDAQVVELSNGNFVLMAANASGYPSVYVYTSAGVLVRGANVFGGSNNNVAYVNSIPGMCATSAGFSVCSSSSSNKFLTTFDFNGAIVFGPTQLQYSSMSSQNNTADANGIVLINNGAAGYAVYMTIQRDGCGSTYNTAIWTFNSAGITTGTVVILQTISNTVAINNQWALLTADGSFVVTQNRTNQGQYWGTYAIARKSVIGVAQEAAAANSTFRCATQGTYTITSNFSYGGNFDKRTATVPGTRGTVAATSAVLFGMS